MLDRHFRTLARGLEERSGDHFEAEVGEGRGDQVGAAVMPVLAHLRDHDPRLAAETVGDQARAFFGEFPASVAARLAVDPAHRLWRGPVAAEGALKRIGNL